LIKFGLLVLEKNKKKFSEFLLLRYYLPLEMGYPFIGTNMNPLPKNDLCQGWLKLA
jgi:hypothetical protein